MTATLRRLVAPLALVAAAIVFYIEAPFSAFGLTGLEPAKNVETFLAALFWILAVLVVFGLVMEQRADAPADGDGPGFVHFLFRNPRASVFWLPIRFFVGFAWLEAGLHKAQGTGWLDGGTALAGFWKGAVAIPASGRPAITFDWFRDFLNVLLNGHAETWFSWLIVFGEIAVGVSLILGAFVGISAVFGGLMNMSFMLAGSASTNPVLLVLAIGLVLGRRVAGYYGLDRYLPHVLRMRPTGVNTRTPTTHVGTPMAA
jgi:thiosulfate dehydrogenase [quinone] large subunit